MGCRPELEHGMAVVESAFELVGKPMVVTSINDGKHGRKSLHPKGFAVDFRTKHITDYEWDNTVFPYIDKHLPDEFDCILESNGLPNEHGHLEYDPYRTATG